MIHPVQRWRGSEAAERVFDRIATGRPLNHDDPNLGPTLNWLSQYDLVHLKGFGSSGMGDVQFDIDAQALTQWNRWRDAQDDFEFEWGLRKTDPVT